MKGFVGLRMKNNNVLFIYNYVYWWFLSPTNMGFHYVEFKNKEACLAVQKFAKETFKGPIGYFCVSSETGEIIKCLPPSFALMLIMMYRLL